MIVRSTRLPSGSCTVSREWLEGGSRIRKRFPSARGFQQEHAALVDLHPERVLGADPVTRTLVLVDLPGGPPPERPEVHEAAGRWLRALHDRPWTDDDPLPLHDALRRRGRAVDCDLEVPPARRVRCHRDFRPANWLWHDGSLTVVDFEHSRGDHPLQDLVKLAIEVWPDRPDLRDAFRIGYGPWEPDVLEALVRLFHAQTARRRSR